jgi:hypothetical protein
VGQLLDNGSWLPYEENARTQGPCPGSKRGTLPRAGPPQPYAGRITAEGRSTRWGYASIVGRLVDLNAAMSALGKALAAGIVEQLKPMLVELLASRDEPAPQQDARDLGLPYTPAELATA